mgnify:CR=1 FL=1
MDRKSFMPGVVLAVKKSKLPSGFDLWTGKLFIKEPLGEEVCYDKRTGSSDFRCTGAVGQEFIRLIEERKFPYSKLKLLASYRSAGKKLTVNGQEYTVEEAKPESFDGVDIGLFAGGSISKELGPEAAKRGCVVIDNSSTFRMDPDVPLVVPEVNPDDIALHKGIIANPNCSTIIMLMALKPIHDLSPIKRIIVSTYQPFPVPGKKGSTNCVKKRRLS